MHQDAVRTFLRLFNCSIIEFSTSTPDCLYGRVAWNYDPQDFQDIAVDMRQKALPDDSLAIAGFLHARGLVDIDRISIPRADLREAFISAGHSDWTSARFDQALMELLEFEVRMVDDGEKTDRFFLHE